jgi:hypothetical protein
LNGPRLAAGEAGRYRRRVTVASGVTDTEVVIPRRHPRLDQALTDPSTGETFDLICGLARPAIAGHRGGDAPRGLAVRRFRQHTLNLRPELRRIYVLLTRSKRCRQDELAGA